jgi:hypothetical protein
MFEVMRVRITILIGPALAIGACTPSAQTTAKQFAACEMDAIKSMGYQQGDWSSPEGRYLYACMRAAGYDLKSHNTPKEGYCTFGDMRRIVLPECYQPMKSGWFDAIKK